MQSAGSIFMIRRRREGGETLPSDVAGGKRERGGGRDGWRAVLQARTAVCTNKHIKGRQVEY